MFFKQKVNTDEIIENISVKDNFIFIHIPKNAGTSVYQALGIQNTSHHTAIQYKQMLGNNYKKYFSFAFCRHPADRFISLYNYARMEESYHHSSINPSQAKYGKHFDYDTLKDKSIQECAHLLLEGKLKHDNRWNHWLPQTTWIVNDEGEIIVDYLGKVEDMALHARNISNILHKQITVEKVNASAKQNIKSYADLDRETIKIIQTYYQKDFDILNYTF